jgi:hypothetical protein
MTPLPLDEQKIAPSRAQSERGERFAFRFFIAALVACLLTMVYLLITI